MSIKKLPNSYNSVEIKSVRMFVYLSLYPTRFAPLAVRPPDLRRELHPSEGR